MVFQFLRGIRLGVDGDGGCYMQVAALVLATEVIAGLSGASPPLTSPKQIIGLIERFRPLQLWLTRTDYLSLPEMADLRVMAMPSCRIGSARQCR